MANDKTGETQAAKGIEPRGNSIRVMFMYQGERIRETLRMPPNPKNMRYAEALREEILKKIALGTFKLCDYFPDSPKCKNKVETTTTLAELAADWLDYKATTLAETTLIEYRNTIKRILLDPLGDTLTSGVNFKLMARHVAGLEFSSAKTRNNSLDVVAGLIRYGIKTKDITDPNTLEALARIKSQSQPPDPFDLDEMLAILGHVAKKYPEILPYFQFAFGAGLRPSEQIVVAWPGVDFRQGLARVDEARVWGILKDTKTHRVRDVELTDLALEGLRQQKAASYMKGGCIFLDPLTGEPFTSTRPPSDRYWKPALKALGIRYRDARQTRHTYATQALMGGANPAYIARQLGNSPEMVLRVYARWIDKGDGGMQRKLVNAQFGGIAPHLPRKDEKSA